MTETASDPIIAETPKTEPPKSFVPPETKIIHKRGGVGFFTASIMSICAALGGAYLSLFTLSQPQLVQTIGLGKFIPVPNAKIPDEVLKDIAALKTDFAGLKTSVQLAQNAQNQAAPLLETKPIGEQGAPNTQTQTSPPQQVANLDPLKAEIAGLGGRLTAIETRLGALDPTGTGGAIIAGLQAEIATLKVKVEELQNTVSKTPSPAVTFAIISLAEAANRSGSFVPEFEALRAALPNMPEIAALEPLSKTGAPNRNQLEQEFALLVTGFEAAKEKAEKPKDFGSWFKSLFSGLVKVEKKKDGQKTGPDLNFENAKTKLMNDDLSGAISELEAINGKTPEIEKWIVSAKSRLDLEGKIAALRGAIERGLASAQMSPNINQPVAAPANQNLAPTNQITPNNNVTNNISGAGR